MQNISTKLEFWKNRLLDLGKRNRLISCPLPKDGKRVQRHSLLISEPNPNDIWAMLLNSDDELLSFPLPPNKDENSEDIIAPISFESKIQTNQSPHETHKTLRSLMKKSKEFTEEKGLNALHLAFGFLNWVENNSEQQEMRSPLLLVPVNLTQNDLFSPIVLSRSDEEISENYALEQKLLNDFGIELPPYTEDIELVDYLNVVSEAVENLGWTVSNDMVQLSLFSFLKINMYRDMERNESKITSNHIVRALNGEIFRNSVDISDIMGYNHDNTEPHDVFSVVDADSSQQDAVLLAKRGVSFVLQGPPGTGKSQTITNIIAELIADGKKVLFVSEKMAALDVVYKRLTQVGLNDFCLSLHNYKAKRREILDQLNKTIKISRQKANIQQEAYDRLYRLKELREVLNRYSADLHTIIEPLGKSIYQATGFLAKYENYRNVDFVQKNVEMFTPVLLSQCKSALEEVTRIISKSGYQQNNPWNGCVLTQPTTFEFRQRFIVDTDVLISQLNKGAVLFSKVNTVLGVNVSWGFTGVELIQQIYNCATESPLAPHQWISIDLKDTLFIIDDYIYKLKERDNARTYLSELCDVLSAIKLTVESENVVWQLCTPISESINSYNESYELLNAVIALKKRCDNDLSALFFNVERGENISQGCDYVLEESRIYNNSLNYHKSVSATSSRIDAELSMFTESVNSEVAISVSKDIFSDNYISEDNVYAELIEVLSKVRNSMKISKEITSYNESLELQKLAITEKERYDSDITTISSCIKRETEITQECKSITENILLYNNAYNCHKSLATEKSERISHHESISKRLITEETTCTNEKQFCDDLMASWQEAQSFLLQDYDIGILSLNISDLLMCFRVNYRSAFKRLGGAYKKDRNAIFAYCKKAIKLDYEQCLSILDSANDVLEKRAKYEQQLIILNNANEVLAVTKNELKEATSNVNDIVEALSFAETRFDSERQNLLSAISSTQNENIKFFENTKSQLAIQKQTLLLAIKNVRGENERILEKTQNQLSLKKQSLLEAVALVQRNSDIELEKAESCFSGEKQNLSIALVNARLASEKKLDEKEQSACNLRNILNDRLNADIGENTDFNKLKKTLNWCIKFKELAETYSFGDEFVDNVCAGNDNVLDCMQVNISDLKNWLTSITPNYEKFISLFNDEMKFLACDFNLLQVLEKVNICRENFASLEYLIDYRIAEKRLSDLGIDSYLAKAKELNFTADEIVPVFEKCFFRSWLDVVIPRYLSVHEFRRLRHDERVTLFKELDKSHLEISKAIVISKLISRLPNFDAFSANGEIALLRREMSKKRRLMPTRLLIAALENLLPVMKPCIMMSPLSVSTYLGNSNFEFDTVIFDEASQVRTEDGIGAIFRAKQVIIAGDSKQLPPSDFFTSSISASDEYEEDEEGEANDMGAYDSLLDEATMLPTQTLLWHYRSRHEHLIAFSNANIYQGSLTTFPSSVENTKGLGVEYVHVEGGIYDRGGKNGNKAEAIKVAELVFEHFHIYPNRSLGIIAFGEVQQSAILDALIEKRCANPAFEPFFKEDREESVFVKNLETVQGDERDTIIFSIGYAPDATGKFIMNFGPLSREGGERRLNVAVTRARYNLILVGSILPKDIATDKLGSLGPKLLRQYIDFAINGVNAILGDTSQKSDLWLDSNFETSVYDFLVSKGYDVSTLVGCSDYRIDLAVRHPKYEGKFAIGIECDGAMYNSARTARERDRLRSTVFEEMGWKIYRVWSTDWIKDRQTEGIRLLAAVDDAINNYRESSPNLNTSTVKMTNFLEVSTQTVNENIREGVQQKFETLRSRYFNYQAKDIPSTDMAETMRKVLENDFGLDKVGLFKETALYGYGWERQGSKIKEKFELAFRSLVHQGHIEEDADGKLRIINGNPLVNARATCKKCKAILDKGDAFCGKCGHKN